jgi:hypothetical protein
MIVFLIHSGMDLIYDFDIIAFLNINGGWFGSQSDFNFFLN